MNDPAFFDAARGLARRMIREGGSLPETRVARGFRLCTGRAPDAAESARLIEAYRREDEHYRARPERAKEVFRDDLQPPAEGEAPELAAWTIVANVLLNLDETITKD